MSGGLFVGIELTKTPFAGGRRIWISMSERLTFQNHQRSKPSFGAMTCEKVARNQRHLIGPCTANQCAPTKSGVSLPAYVLHKAAPLLPLPVLIDLGVRG